MVEQNYRNDIGMWLEKMKVFVTGLYHLHEILFILLNVIIFMFLEVLHKEDKRNQNWSWRPA